MARALLGASKVSVAFAVVAIAGSAVVAQNALAQLGLTESAARRYVLAEVKGPQSGQGSAMVLTGRFAFQKIPAAARDQVATGLFAWAKAYVESPAFKTAYAAMRAQGMPAPRQYRQTVAEQVKQELSDQLAGLNSIRQSLPSLPPADRPAIEANLKDSETQLRDPATEKAMRERVEADRAKEQASFDDGVKRWQERYPADPQVIFARTLREFLEKSADVDFAAKTISLTGSPDGLEFVNPADRSRPWQWQEAAIVGREATAAARAAAEVWLKEIAK